MENELVIRGPVWELFAKVSGEGPPFLFLHGQFGTHAVVRQLIEDLDERRTLITPDIRGRGRSICPDASLHTWIQYADDVIAFLDKLAFARAAIGGVSLGTGIALATAMRHPDRVSALVLHSSVYAGEEKGWLPSQKPLQKQVLATARQVSEGGFDALDNEAPESTAKWMRHDEQSVSAALLGLGLSQPFNDAEDLRKITHPTLVIRGFDALHPPEVSELYMDSIPQARSLAAFPADAESTTSAIEEFLDDAET